MQTHRGDHDQKDGERSRVLKAHTSQCVWHTRLRGVPGDAASSTHSLRNAFLFLWSAMRISGDMPTTLRGLICLMRSTTSDRQGLYMVPRYVKAPPCTLQIDLAANL